MSRIARIAAKRHLIYGAGLLASGVILALNGLTGHSSAQGANSMYLTPASGTYAVGDDITVSIRVNTTDQVNAVQADLSYSGNLQFVSFDGNGSAFGINASSTGGGGSASSARATITPVSGDQLITKITFKTLSAGTGTVTLAGSSQALSSTTNTDVLTTRNGGSYTISSGTTPPATPPSTPPATPPSTPPATPPSTPPSTPTTKPNGTTTTKASSGLPATTVAPQGSSQTTPLPGDTTVQLNAPATVETTPAADKDVSKVEYLLNGKVVTTDTTPPYSHALDTVNMRNGNYELVTKTYYKNGKVDSSKASLIVKNPMDFKQLMLQLRHYAWLLIILVIVAGELLYLKFFKKRGGFGAGGSGSGTTKPNVFVGGNGPAPGSPGPTTFTPGGSGH